MEMFASTKKNCCFTEHFSDATIYNDWRLIPKMSQSGIDKRGGCNRVQPPRLAIYVSTHTHALLSKLFLHSQS